MNPLEERFPPELLPEKVNGIIVLAGAIEPEMSVIRGQPIVNNSAERLFTFAYLSRRYPEAKLVFTGGAGDLVSGHRHSDIARIIFEQLGLDVDRIIFESQSRNTYENAVNSFNLIKPKKSEKWALITSAFHMARAVGVFRKTGWEVIPYPVDYQTKGSFVFEWRYRGFQQIEKVEHAMHEWLGLFVYWATGKTNQLFPGPLH